MICSQMAFARVSMSVRMEVVSYIVCRRRRKASLPDAGDAVINTSTPSSSNASRTPRQYCIWNAGRFDGPRTLNPNKPCRKTMGSLGLSYFSYTSLELSIVTGHEVNMRQLPLYEPSLVRLNWFGPPRPYISDSLLLQCCRSSF